jgi:hypothetical protein
MTQELLPIELTAEQKGRVHGILSVGCDRETAANFIGCSLVDFAEAMKRDSEFAASVRKTEAAVELAHMRTVQQAAKEEKNWRASVWWLERRSPERFGSRGAGTVTTKHLKAFLNVAGAVLNAEIQDPADRERVMNRLTELYALVDDITRDDWQNVADADDLSTANESGIDDNLALTPSDDFSAEFSEEL